MFVFFLFLTFLDDELLVDIFEVLIEEYNKVICLSVSLSLSLSNVFISVWLLLGKNEVQGGSRKTGPPSRRPTWAYVSDSVQEIKEMQMQSTYWLEKVLKMISAVSFRRIDTTHLHRVYDSVLQRAQKCIEVQEDHFQHFL
jgi:predicted transcriptional regulator